MDFWLAGRVHWAACVLHIRRGWEGHFMNMGNLGKVLVVGLSALFLDWVYTHVTELTCEAWDLAFCCIFGGNGILGRLHARMVSRHQIYTSTRTDSTAASRNPRKCAMAGTSEKAPLCSAPRFLSVTRAVTRAGTSLFSPKASMLKIPHTGPWPRPLRPVFERRTHGNGEVGAPCTRVGEEAGCGPEGMVCSLFENINRDPLSCTLALG